MKKILVGIAIVAVFVVALWSPSLVSPAYACKDGKPCEDAPGQQDDSGQATEEASSGGGGNASGGGQQGGGQLPIGGNAGPVDPCVAAGNCGNGDHGKGNPVNGSLHANCRAAQGEVDPVCPTPPAGGTPPSVTGTPPAPTGTSVVVIVTGTPVPGDGGEGNVIEVDGEQVDFNLEPYKAPVDDSYLLYHQGEWGSAINLSAPFASTTCSQNCCCQCQENWDWLRLAAFLAILILAIIAGALLLRRPR